MTNSIVIGAICFAVIVLVDKFVPIKVRWQRALTAAIVAGICITVWMTIFPI